MIYAVVALVTAGAIFYAGKRYGARVEAAAIGRALFVRSLISREVGLAYRAVIADIKAKEQSVLARVKKAL